MKKILKTTFILLLVVSILIPTFNVSSAEYVADGDKTLKQVKQDLAKFKAEQNQIDSNISKNKNEVTSSKNSIASKQKEIEDNQQKVVDATNESARLEKEIKEGKAELENLVKNYQIANGENIYLEYIFEAESYEDLIYRYAVMEQIMNYQEDKIASWRDKIERNEQLKKDLAAREILLNDQINNLSKEIDELNKAIKDFSEERLSVQEEIQSVQSTIDSLVNLGCKDDQKISTCLKDADTSFRRPLTKGVITSVWGYRTHPTTGKPNTFHNGIDIGGNSVGTPIYAAANGTVGKVIWKSSCGGNQVYIYHTINGKKYTTSYLHLNSINVKVGQFVKNTAVIGTVGGQKGTGDNCTTGAHLHFGMGTGWYGLDYISGSTWQARSVNPTSQISFPAKGKYFYSRY